MSDRLLEGRGDIVNVLSAVRCVHSAVIAINVTTGMRKATMLAAPVEYRWNVTGYFEWLSSQIRATNDIPSPSEETVAPVHSSAKSRIRNGCRILTRFSCWSSATAT